MSYPELDTVGELGAKQRERQARGPRRGKRGPFELADEAEDSSGQRREEVLEMRLAPADIARSPHACVARRFGERA